MIISLITQVVWDPASAILNSPVHQGSASPPVGSVMETLTARMEVMRLRSFAILRTIPQVAFLVMWSKGLSSVMMAGYASTRARFV